MPDREARRRLSSDLDTTFFVEAGAGTGKTRELVARVVVLVARGRLMMSGLAAITFTEAAAAELRDRIRRELAQAALDDESWTPEQRRLCLDASRCVDLAHIQTIHAFAGDLLRTFPLEAELPPGFMIWDEMQRDRDFTERFRAWLYDEVPSDPSPARRDALSRVLGLGLPPERLALLAQRLQEHYDLLESGAVWDAGTPADLVAVAKACGDSLLQLFPLLEYANDGEADPLVQQVRPIAFAAQRLADAADAASAIEALLRYLLKKPNPLRSSPWRWTAHPMYGDPVAFMRETLQGAGSAIETALESNRAAALADLLGHLSEFTLAYARDRKARGVATFHDLLVWARDLLRDHPEVRLQAHARIERLFVDEFQDTDPLQAELIAYVTADPALAHERDWTVLLGHIVPGKLFVVGDPKQSIYRFRRAEVAVYERVYAAADQPGAARASLVQTFRAIEPLVGWVNAHFSAAMRAEKGTQAAYARLESRPDLPGVALDAARAGVRIVGGPDDRKAGERWTLEAQTIARLALKAVHEQWPVTEQEDGIWQVRPACFKDICVLLPTRTNLRRLERAFEQNSVPYRMESGSLVVFTQEVRDLVACLRSIEDPSDQVALVAALRSPAYACSDVDLLRWVEDGGRLSYVSSGLPLDGPVGSALRSLLDFHTCRTERSAAAIVEALIRDRCLAVVALDHPRPREALRRQRYVVAQARKLASAGDPTLRGFVHWIETLRMNELYDAESAVPDSDENAVRFRTVHGSKGLEFPIVILSGLGGGARPTESVQLLAHHSSGSLEARITARIGPAFRTTGFNADREKGMAEAEQLRLLYVASTRAREHLVLSLFHSYRYGKNTHAAAICDRLQFLPPGLVHQIEMSDLDAFPSPELRVDFDPVPESLSPEAHLQSESAWQTARDHRLVTLGHEPLATPSGLAHAADAAAPFHPPQSHLDDPFLPPSDEHAVVSPRRAAGGTAVGTAVHAVLQWLDLESLSNLDRLAAWAAVESQVDGEAVANLARNAALSPPVRRAVASGRYWREVPVSLDIDGVLLEGAIDLLYQDQDGSMVVVDYKTDRPTSAGRADRVDHYRLQGGAYALAVSVATAMRVSRVEFIFAAESRDKAEVFVVHEPAFEDARAAIARSPAV